MITVKSFEFNYFSVNTYILHDETGEAVLIDCGCFRREEELELSNYIIANKLTVKHLLCTHLHLDHIFGNEFVNRTYGLKPLAHKADAEMLPSPQEQAKLFGLQDRLQSIPVEKYIVGNEIIKFGNSELTALLVPGHSPGSLAFYNKKDGFAITGDAIFSGSIGRTDLWGGNQEVLIAAIKDKILSLPDETILYPGHGPKTNVIEESLSNPFL
ncbi:hydroxyacylglutathione hydrolase [Parabacteroides sp. PF5-5]|uniref:MBL fold metallo-hydrolase n=1 Tax=unclassified Parabacteroides TaxID=2649774 RepID=UPI0024770B62|nr:MULTISPECIES: MBL fold metallo-hydrolase [unclassified Parabacteroides]MDH6304382.1 hydroxyacylglutathione hydrolase [Parabacteroides sp. PH5-39]MDH6315465.1 hydroxyacylglutathione hydrolase [Parabacteroides sp. PF5-13]MDH6319041.1 hydroxyacylglutathione hydrolase [Parabacteroides sp. PH5-13]MDH6322771.1 hydroxyacylglutathione hydrolase [Parabacteroides sp. PH5-8]MDH6326657.1 hydroxyacylglutathione hydrolase [Parabacteroides sp. PH5-41]